MKALLLSLTLALVSSLPLQAQSSTVPPSNDEQAVLDLSKSKWAWMADKDLAKLDELFAEKAMFVHMSGKWDKARELEVIKSGRIWYKQAEAYSAVVNLFGDTAILLTEIDLIAVVGGNEVVNAFMVTEVYIKENSKWKMGSLSFSTQRRPVKLKIEEKVESSK
ncbi:nuclear transport factor 2 family protein [Oleiharenicola lentus]|uniref:nuclear transport factor 2 family protein n=1 Tax=Oleiharenicola lentus TaxID=2508720 RepID=UPI003F664A14